eukprot:1352055-Prymnesium_polylepis.1
MAATLATLFLATLFPSTLLASVAALPSVDTASQHRRLSQCSDTCRYPLDGNCDDGGPGYDFSNCAFGTDCT